MWRALSIREGVKKVKGTFCNGGGRDINGKFLRLGILNPSLILSNPVPPRKEFGDIFLKPSNL